MKADYYWERIKDIHKFFFASLAFLIVALALFGQQMIGSFAALLFLAAAVTSPLAFIYYAYKDKQALAVHYDGVNERHWVTIVVFMWLTGGLYAFAYTLIRTIKYDPADSEQTQTGAQKLYTAGQSVVKGFYGGDAGSESDSSGSSRASSGTSSRSPTTTSTSDRGTARSSQSRTQTSRSSQSSVSSSPSSSSTGGSRARSSTDSGRSQQASGTGTDVDTDTNVFRADSDAGTGNTEIFDPAQGDDSHPDTPSPASSGGSSSGSTTQFCGYCGIDLSQYGEPQFCPDCGTEAE